MELLEFNRKTTRLKNIIKKTILAVQKYKNLDIILAGELNNTLEFLNNLFIAIKNLTCSNVDVETRLNEITIQLINLIKNYGTEDLTDVIITILGENAINKLYNNKKFELLKQYVHPINCKLISKNNNNSNENNKITQFENLTCLDNSEYSNKFQLLVYGIKVVINDDNNVLIINGIVDDVGLMFLDNEYIRLKQENIEKFKISNNLEAIEYQKYIKTLSLKDMLIYTDDQLVCNFTKLMSDVENMNGISLSETIEKFTSSNLFNQREILIKLLIKDNAESKYLAYLLYDLLSNENNGIIDTYEQTLLYDSLPWNLRKYFNEAMKQTIQYTNNLNNSSNNKLPLEQQICLLKVDDSVKEKAMTKLKEVKNKSEDTGTKAKLFLDGLLKIPFKLYCEESILKTSQNIKTKLNLNIERTVRIFKLDYNFDKNIIKNNYELDNILDTILKDNLYNITDTKINVFLNGLNGKKRPYLIKTINNINSVIKKEHIKTHKLIQSGKNSKDIISSINEFVKNNSKFIERYFYFINDTDFDTLALEHSLNDVKVIKDEIILIKKYMENVETILDKSVYGHQDAKRQIQRIIGQWINGTNSGHCFGFEGPPGVGKTSLAKKGISICLKDFNGKSRPFSFIAMGGSSNGSVLEGHSYTYVGSTWGKIVDILIDSKCMNPIIFIDELDKISNTENGKEIIGILTHLIDPTQNDCFQDKYFNGINLDLSKALFIFSYNDVNLIDKILLDRIHRIKFDFLTLQDKIEIVKNFILPEMYENMGLQNIIIMNDNVIEYLIETYTNESGVRKLKELIFEIMGEININILKNNNYKFPLILTNDDIKLYLKQYNYIINKTIHETPGVGIINGLWANSIGCGGILPIEVSSYPCNTLMELKLTGTQGDVMKESMNVAKTLACNLTNVDTLTKYIKSMQNLNMQGIHIHCPEGATPKDGPSAGTAITIAIYSLINKRLIKNYIAITGEITLQGNVIAIGGLDLKITGGLKAGIKEFIYPKENHRDYLDFIDKNSSLNLEAIKFTAVDNINDVIDIIMM